MSAALLVLAGAVVGVMGTLGTELIRSRGEDRRSQREAVRQACIEFSMAINRMRETAFELHRDPSSQVFQDRAQDANMTARARYENLRLVTSSKIAQEAGRRALRHAFGMQLRARAMPIRDDEADREPQALVQDWLTRLYVEVRQETGVPHAYDVYQEPDRWLGVGQLPHVDTAAVVRDHGVIGAGQVDVTASEHGCRDHDGLWNTIKMRQPLLSR